MKTKGKFVLLLGLFLIVILSLIPIDKILAAWTPVRNYKEAIVYVDGSSTHTATCTQIDGGTMKWDNYTQTQTNWPSTLPYNDGEFSGTLYRATQDLVEIERLGGPCSSPSDVGNVLNDRHIYLIVKFLISPIYYELDGADGMAALLD